MIQPAAQSFLEGIGASAAIQDLIVNGIIGGLGAVLGFVPDGNLILIPVYLRRLWIYGTYCDFVMGPCIPPLRIIR